MRTGKKTFLRTTVWMTMALVGTMSLLLLLFSGVLLALDTAAMQAQLRAEAADSLRCRLNTLSDVTGTLNDYFIRNGYVAFTGKNNHLRDPVEWFAEQDALDVCTGSLRIPDNLLEAVFILGRNDNQTHYVMEYDASTGQLVRREQEVPALDSLLSGAFGELFSCLYEINRLNGHPVTDGMDAVEKAFARRLAGRAVYVDIHETSAILYLYTDTALAPPSAEFVGEVYNSRDVPIWRFSAGRPDATENSREILTGGYSVRYEIGKNEAYILSLWAMPAILAAVMLLAFGIIYSRSRHIVHSLAAFHEVLLRQATENKLVQAQQLPQKERRTIRGQVFRAVSASVIAAAVLCTLLTSILQASQTARLQEKISDIATVHIADDADMAISGMQMLGIPFDYDIIREIKQNPAVEEMYADKLDTALANTAFEAMTTIAFLTDTDGTIVYTVCAESGDGEFVRVRKTF